MRKYLVVLLTLALVSGCSYSNSSINSSIKARVDDVLSTTTKYNTNVTKKYFSYYLPTYISKKTSTDLSFLVVDNGTKILGNVDANEILLYHNLTTADYIDGNQVLINEYSELFNNFDNDFKDFYGTSKNVIASASGTINNYDLHATIPFSVYVHRVSDDRCFVTTKIGFVRFSSFVNDAGVPNIVNDMVLMGKSLNVNTMDIVAAYDNSYIPDNVASNEDLGIEIIDEDGYLSDYVKE